MQRHQSGRTVEPDQFLWLQHPNFCSGCQLARQIPYNYEGNHFTKAFNYNLLFNAMHVCVCAICAESMRLILFDFQSRDVDSHLVQLC